MGFSRADLAAYLKKTSAAWTEAPSPAEMNNLLRALAQWRSFALERTFLAHHGPVIYQGPFQGMTYVETASEGALIPRLLGTYESELHPHIAAFAEAGLDCVVDVGCAEGYYAVGLARHMPGVTVYAHDIDERARTLCAELAAKNGVADRVVVGGEFQPQDFQRFAGQRVLVMVDTEGAEVDILDPARGPALAGMNIVVETHDLYRAGALRTLVDRFSATHDIVQVNEGPKSQPLPPWLLELNTLDKLLAVWEWRRSPTPWLVMRPKAP